MAKKTPKLSKKDQQKIEKDVEKRLHKRLLSATKTKTVYVHNQFRDHASTALIAAFGFLIALAWRDLLSKVIKENIAISTLEKVPYIAELWSAFIITLVAILGIALVSRWANKKEK
ncbi:hypothetical protein CMI47_05740 [Candidatus Pacearchaeota archaeon]|nr:hypothetical protein [Candidatus Pacearchaeota archaeon]|tara:strand:+ start:423 stop:770 length:348 start_codon:yes stop_codon:yes gene_type:complete